MRITGGIFKGRRLKSRRANKLRPATDMVRQAVFNIIGKERVESARVLDLFAGTGAYGIEALSRGASTACFVEQDRINCEIIRENVEMFELKDSVSIFNLDAFYALRKFSREKFKFSLIFADPPYRKNFIKKLNELIDRNQILEEDGIVVIEHSKDELTDNDCEGLMRFIFKKYGDSCISIYKGG